jgi:uncharacterized protein
VIREGLRDALRRAMKDGDRVAVSALRATLGVIDNAEAVDGPATPPPADGVVAHAVAGVGATEVARRMLTDADVRAIVTAEIGERRTAADGYEAAGRGEAVDRLRAEVAVLEGVLAP